jgi:hypothetical protein
MVIVDNKEPAMQNIEQYLEHIRNDYAAWNTGVPSKGDEIKQRFIAEFRAGVCIKEGSKYIKVCTNNGGTAHTFIVKKDAGKFRAGDILKAASYAAPALNFARGNVIAGDWANVRWTGA